VDFLPAIDVRNGRVVRLSQGESARQTVYSDDPISIAEQFIAQGAEWLHVVDLDRAFGQGENTELIRDLIRIAGRRARVQLGGGFRDLGLVRSAIASGAARVVIGTAAALDPAFIPAAALAVGPDRLAVGVDVRKGRVALRGWTETCSRSPQELAHEVLDQGVETLVYTDIERDGMLQGPDADGALVLRSSGARVILSGGVATVAQVAAACTSGLDGIIVGRALYEGRFSLAEGRSAAACAPAR
jgi:phosphoribosylformimino-5-aminoimidazole carboxamide ribotide isomerase